MRKLLNHLRAWWRDELTMLDAPKEWAASVKTTDSIQCPICYDSYKISELGITRNATQVTVVCAKRGCGEQMEAYPDPYFGWAKPRVEWREKSFA